MPSGWSTYYIVVFAAALAMGIPVSLRAVSWLLSPRRSARGQDHGKLSRVGPLASGVGRDRSTLGARINPRFFLAANAALCLLVLMLALVPCVGTLHAGAAAGRGDLRSLLVIVTIAGFATLGLLYSARKGDLGWLRTFRPSGNDRKGV